MAIEGTASRYAAARRRSRLLIADVKLRGEALREHDVGRTEAG